MKKILITGANSLLGSGLIKTVPKSYRLFLGWHTHPILIANSEKVQSLPIDITNPMMVRKAFEAIIPDIVIHLAAQSDVDYCEQRQKEAYTINVEGTINIAEMCKIYKKKIIFISSNAVFDGANPPYIEEDTPHPINFYGQTKYAGEVCVKKMGVSYVIARLITMYGWQPHGSRLNPVTWILQELQNKKKLRIVNDRFINPLFNLSAAEAIWAIIKKGQEGIFHIAGKNRVSRYEWAKEVARVFDFPLSLISPVASSFFSHLVSRPIDTSFATTKMESVLNVMPLSIEEGLMRMREEK